MSPDNTVECSGCSERIELVNGEWVHTVNVDALSNEDRQLCPLDERTAGTYDYGYGMPDDATIAARAIEALTGPTECRHCGEAIEQADDREGPYWHHVDGLVACDTEHPDPYTEAEPEGFDELPIPSEDALDQIAAILADVDLSAVMYDDDALEAITIIVARTGRILNNNG